MYRSSRESGVDRRHATTAGERVALHPEHAIHLVAEGEIRVTRVDDAPDAARTHHLADLDRRYVRPTRVHPRPHRRIDRKVLDPHKKLAVRRTADGAVDDLPIRGLG